MEGPLIDDLDVAWNRCEVRYGVFRDYFSAHGFNQGREPVINERVKMVGRPASTMSGSPEVSCRRHSASPA